MFYRSSRSLIAALIVATLGAFAPIRADDRTSDLELKLKEKEAEYKELQQKVQSQQAKQPDQASQAPQQPGSPYNRSSDNVWEPADVVKLRTETVRAIEGQLPFRVRMQVGSAGAIHTAAAELRDAKGDEDRKAAQKKLDEALSKYFDDDMVQREKEIKQVEERVTKLRESLEHRRASKQEIIDLEAKVALNEANGLGFYDGEPSGGPLFHPMDYKAAVSGSSSGNGPIPNFNTGGFGSIGPRVKAAPPGPPTKVGPEGEPPQPK